MQIIKLAAAFAAFMRGDSTSPQKTIVRDSLNDAQKYSINVVTNNGAPLTVTQAITLPNARSPYEITVVGYRAGSTKEIHIAQILVSRDGDSIINVSVRSLFSPTPINIAPFVILEVGTPILTIQVYNEWLYYTDLRLEVIIKAL